MSSKISGSEVFSDKTETYDIAILGHRPARAPQLKTKSVLIAFSKGGFNPLRSHL